MAKTRWYDDKNTIVSSYHPTFTTVLSRVHHRIIAFSSSYIYHRTYTILPPCFAVQGDEKYFCSNGTPYTPVLRRLQRLCQWRGAKSSQDRVKDFKEKIPLLPLSKMTEESRKPGPADYKVKHVNLKKNPSYTCRQRVKTSYPDSVTYDKAAGTDPGPGAYDPSREITESNKPAYSLGKRLESISDKENMPGPNAYIPEKRDKPGSKKAPSFSMAKRLLPPNSRKDYPGPSEYSPNPKVYETEKGKCTISSRLRRKEAYVNPVAPNLYTLPELISGKKKGVIFKSRASPYVYSGFRTKNIEEPRSLPAIAN